MKKPISIALSLLMILNLTACVRLKTPAANATMKTTEAPTAEPTPEPTPTETPAPTDTPEPTKAPTPTPVPTAIIDNDNTSMSRALTRQLRANANIEIRNGATSYATAMDMVNRGEIIGFFLVPSGFESDAIGGRKPVVSYYCNMTYFIPASLIYKGFKATAITTSGSVVRTSLVSSGMDENSGAM